MNVLILGGEGRYALLLAEALRKLGHNVWAPGRSEADASDEASIAAYCGKWLGAFNAYSAELTAGLDLEVNGPGWALVEKAAEEAVAKASEEWPEQYDLIVCAAGFVDVAAMERGEGQGINEDIGSACGAAANVLDVPLVYISTDYAGTFCAYGRSKRYAEEEVLRRAPVATVVRVAFLHMEDAKKYTWTNDYTLSNREWSGESARRLADWLHDHEGDLPQGIRTLGPSHTTTVAALCVEAGLDVETIFDGGEVAKRLGYPVPQSTAF